MPFAPMVQDRSGEYILRGAEGLARGIQEAGNAWSGYLDKQKQLKDNAKAMDTLVKANPEMLDKLKITPEEWGNLGSRDKVSVVTGMIQGNALKAAQQQIAAQSQRMQMNELGMNQTRQEMRGRNEDRRQQQEDRKVWEGFSASMAGNGLNGMGQDAGEFDKPSSGQMIKRALEQNPNAALNPNFSKYATSMGYLDQQTRLEERDRAEAARQNRENALWSSVVPKLPKFDPAKPDDWTKAVTEMGSQNPELWGNPKFKGYVEGVVNAGKIGDDWTEGKKPKEFDTPGGNHVIYGSGGQFQVMPKPIEKSTEPVTKKGPGPNTAWVQDGKTGAWKLEQWKGDETAEAELAGHRDILTTLNLLKSQGVKTVINDSRGLPKKSSWGGNDIDSEIRRVKEMIQNRSGGNGSGGGDGSAWDDYKAWSSRK